MNSFIPAILALMLLGLPMPAVSAGDERSRLIVETDAGGDPDDEQSLVRLLLYANDLDIEGIIANRPVARPGENRNPERTGLGIVRRLLNAYGECRTNLVQHDPRYPTREHLWARSVPGYNETDEAVKFLIAAIDGPDPRPIWYSDWGTDHGGATNNLKRALDRVLRERGAEGYARFKSRLRLASADAFGEHTSQVAPAFSLWVDTFRPAVNGRRWYHQFSALTGRAGGFDLMRDVLQGHGPLGAMYPTNTTHWAKEGDSMTFIYLLPNGLNAPEEPTWGGWAGRYGANTNYPGKPYYWASLSDRWNGTTNRNNTLARWASALQNDFRARLDWCTATRSGANHPPEPAVRGGLGHGAESGGALILDAAGSTDPDGHRLRFSWFHYPEASGYVGEPVQIANANSAVATLRIPPGLKRQVLHVILEVTDEGEPALTRYCRVLIEVNGREASRHPSSTR